MEPEMLVFIIISLLYVISGLIASIIAIKYGQKYGIAINYYNIYGVNMILMLHGLNQIATISLFIYLYQFHTNRYTIYAVVIAVFFILYRLITSCITFNMQITRRDNSYCLITTLFLSNFILDYHFFETTFLSCLNGVSPHQRVLSILEGVILCPVTIIISSLSLSYNDNHFILWFELFVSFIIICKYVLPSFIYMCNILIWTFCCGCCDDFESPKIARCTVGISPYDVERIEYNYYTNVCPLYESYFDAKISSELKEERRKSWRKQKVFLISSGTESCKIYEMLREENINISPDRYDMKDEKNKLLLISGFIRTEIDEEIYSNLPIEIFQIILLYYVHGKFCFGDNKIKSQDIIIRKNTTTYLHIDNIVLFDKCLYFYHVIDYMTAIIYCTSLLKFNQYNDDDENLLRLCMDRFDHLINSQPLVEIPVILLLMDKGITFQTQLKYDFDCFRDIVGDQQVSRDEYITCPDIVKNEYVTMNRNNDRQIYVHFMSEEIRNENLTQKIFKDIQEIVIYNALDAAGLID